MILFSFALMKKLMTSFLSSKVPLAKYYLKMKVDLNKVRGVSRLHGLQLCDSNGGLGCNIFARSKHY